MKLKVTLTRSLIARKPNQVKTAHALGLKLVGHSVTVDKTPQSVGMINTIAQDRKSVV